MNRLPHFPIKDGPWRMAMGLEPLDPAEWIEPDNLLEEQLAEKDRLIAERRSDVIAEVPGSGHAQAELLEKLVQHLPKRFPQLYRRDGDTMRIGKDRSVSLTGPCAIETAGRLAQEDFCLMQSPADGDPYHLTAASVCFPTRWRMLEKIGKPMQAIHGPVPLLNEQMGRHLDRFFATLNRDRPVSRINWSLIDNPALFQPTGHGLTEADPRFQPDSIGHEVWFRSERQTLLRLPLTGAIVFGIRIYQTTLAELSSDPIRASRLLNAVETMDPAMDRYKSLAVFRDPLKNYLSTRTVNK